MKKFLFVISLGTIIVFNAKADLYQKLEPCKENEYRIGAFCTSCASTELGYVGSNPDECFKCKDSEGKQTRRLIHDWWCAIIDCGKNNFQDENGRCWPCSTPQKIFSTKTECLKCKDKKGIPTRKSVGDSCFPTNKL